MQTCSVRGSTPSWIAARTPNHAELIRYGSAVGAAVGALISAWLARAFVYANWDSDWFQAFLGVLLLLATLLNHYIRRRAEAVKR